MALTAGKRIKRRAGLEGHAGVAAGATIYQGGLVMLMAGVARAAAAQASAGAANTCVAVGIAKQTVTNTGADGAVGIDFEPGVYCFKNSSGGDLIAAANIGAAAYIVDDETVALTNNSNVRPKAGTIVDVTSDGVWVRVGV